MKNLNVAILGASDHEYRYSYKANSLLKENGFNTFLVNPNHDVIKGQKCFKSVSELNDIDTITVYVRDSISNSMIDDIIKLAPRRVIFNPGSENDLIYKQLQDNKIIVEQACTLVLLNTGQF
ncbi:MAG: CoA-binding protein [Bacteriovoracaceae bacterium]